MKFADIQDHQETLNKIGRAYEEMFYDYRGEFGFLDSNKWSKVFAVDYILEVIFVTFGYLNFTCERIIEYVQASEVDEDYKKVFMPDYDLGYKIAQDVSAVISFAHRSKIKVRASLIQELFYAHVLYINLSDTAGRCDWYDVNKRMRDSMISLIIFQPALLELLNSWREYGENIDEEDLDDSNSPERILWKSIFIEGVIQGVKESH